MSLFSLSTLANPRISTHTVSRESASTATAKQTNYTKFFSALKTGFVGTLFLMDSKSLVLASGIPSDEGSFFSNKNMLQQQQCAWTHSSQENLCEGYVLMAGDLAESELIFLAEKHSKKLPTSKCVEKLSQNSKKHQRILLESYPAGMVVPCTERMIANSENRTCIGWDTMSYSEDAVRRTQKGALRMVFEERQQSLKNIQNIDGNPKEIDDHCLLFILEIDAVLSHIGKNRAVPSKYRKLVYQTLLASQNASRGQLLTILLVNKIVETEIMKFRGQGESYTQIINKNVRKIPFTSYFESCGKNQDCSEFKTKERERNKGLIRMAKEQAEDGVQVIAIAGAAHLVPDITQMSILSGEARYVQK